MVNSNITNVNLATPGEGNPIEKAFIAFLNNGSTVQVSSVPPAKVSVNCIINQTSTNTISSFGLVVQRTGPVPVVFTGYLGLLMSLQEVLPLDHALPAPTSASLDKDNIR